jgi:hypothetical protein
MLGRLTSKLPDLSKCVVGKLAMYMMVEASNVIVWYNGQ